jgi:hypothetical protein
VVDCGSVVMRGGDVSSETELGVWPVTGASLFDGYDDEVQGDHALGVDNKKDSLSLGDQRSSEQLVESADPNIFIKEEDEDEPFLSMHARWDPATVEHLIKSEPVDEE